MCTVTVRILALARRPPGAASTGGASREILVVLLVLAGFVVCGLISANVARAKGHSGGSWFLTRFFFGLLDRLSAVGMPDRGSRVVPRPPR